MSNTTISPNMNLPVPTVGTDPGPDWANNINASLNAIDSHNHAAGQGVQITPDGININSDLPMKGNNLTTANSLGLNSLNAALTALLQSLQCVGVDLYFIDGVGNSVRITQGGSVTGATGTITGLPSGTASASFAAGTFTFQSATNTPATMAVGPLVIGAATVSSKTITIAPNAAQPANYAVTLPLALPAAAAIMACDASGQENFTEPDNTTFGIQASKYGVLDGGIGPTQLDAPVYGTANATTPGSTIITSTSYVNVPGLSVTVTASGLRNVMVALSTQYSAGLPSYISIGTSSYFDIRFLRDSTTPIIETRYLASSGSLIPPAVVAFDVLPAAGAHTYVIQARVATGGSVEFAYPNLFVQEI